MMLKWLYFDEILISKYVILVKEVTGNIPDTYIRYYVYISED